MNVTDSYLPPVIVSFNLPFNNVIQRAIVLKVTDGVKAQPGSSCVLYLYVQLQSVQHSTSNNIHILARGKYYFFIE